MTDSFVLLASRVGDAYTMWAWQSEGTQWLRFVARQGPTFGGLYHPDWVVALRYSELPEVLSGYILIAPPAWADSPTRFRRDFRDFLSGVAEMLPEQEPDQDSPAAATDDLLFLPPDAPDLIDLIDSLPRHVTIERSGGHWHARVGAHSIHEPTLRVLVETIRRLPRGSLVEVQL